MVMSNLKIFSLERAVSIKYVHKVLTTRCLCAKIMNSGFADMAELADALDLGSSTVRCGGSIPLVRTIFLSILLKTVKKRSSRLSAAKREKHWCELFLG